MAITVAYITIAILIIAGLVYMTIVYSYGKMMLQICCTWFSGGSVQLLEPLSARSNQLTAPETVRMTT